MFDARNRNIGGEVDASSRPALRSGRSEPADHHRMSAPPAPRGVRRSRLRRALARILPARTADSLARTVTRAQVKSGSLLGDPLQLSRPAQRRECPSCGYRGRLWSFGRPARREALCPRCLSLERHRLMHLLLDRYADSAIVGKRVLHFAPERCVRERLVEVSRYMSADISGRGVDCRCAMEAMPFADGSIDTVIANHVLEHVDDDFDALREIRRVLRPGGLAILSVPIVFGWDATYEDPRIVAPEQRRAHFGQEDHKRLYGRDFADRLRCCGFAVETFRSDPPGEVRYGLRRGDRFYLAWPDGEPADR